MNYIFIVIIVVIVLYLIFKHLLKQSKKPTGIVGNLMMKLWNNVYLPMAEWCLSFLSKKEYGNILDIGVGNGATTNYISNHFICESIIGIDISKSAIEQAKIKNQNSSIKFEEKDIKTTQYPSNNFDLICAFQNHFHWEYLRESFLEIRRIMSDDGILLIGCEYSKIKYYLSDLSLEKDFREYLDNLNLDLIQARQNKDWILYKIIKK